MKEISEVIEEYEKKVNPEIMKPDIYKEILLKTKMFAKQDLCEIVEIDNLENYQRVNSFSSYVLKDSKNFYLYRENETNNLIFIYKKFDGTRNKTGFGLKIDHISDEDYEKLQELTLKDEKMNARNSSNGLFVFGIIIIIFGVIALSLLLIIIGVVMLILAGNSKQMSDINVKMDTINEESSKEE